MYNESWPSINQCSILIIMWRNYKKKEKKKPLFEVEGVKVKKKPDLVDKLDRIFSLFIRYRDTIGRRKPESSGTILILCLLQTLAHKPQPEHLSISNSATFIV